MQLALPVLTFMIQNIPVFQLYARSAGSGAVRDRMSERTGPVARRQARIQRCDQRPPQKEVGVETQTVSLHRVIRQTAQPPSRLRGPGLDHRSGCQRICEGAAGMAKASAVVCSALKGFDAKIRALQTVRRKKPLLGSTNSRRLDPTQVGQGQPSGASVSPNSKGSPSASAVKNRFPAGSTKSCLTASFTGDFTGRWLSGR